MPSVSREDVKKPQRRQNRAGQFFLDVNVALNNVGVRTESAFTQGVDVFAIKSFVETDLVECGLRMKNCDGMQRRARRECMRCQAQKNSDSENDREQDDVYLTKREFGNGHGSTKLYRVRRLIGLRGKSKIKPSAKKAAWSKS